MKRNFLPWVVPEYCEGCTSCIAACKKGCLTLHATEDEEVFIPWLENPDECTGCAKCSESCAMGGIAMTAYVDEAAERFHKFYQSGKVRKV